MTQPATTTQPANNAAAAIRVMKYLLSQCREEAEAAILKLQEDAAKSPSHLFEWGQNYYHPFMRMRIANRIQAAYDENAAGYDENDPIADRDRWFDALSREIKTLTETLTRNRLAARSSSAFSNACTEVEREASADMLRDLEGIYSFFAKA